VKGTIFTKYRQFVDNCFALIPRHALHAASLGFTHPETGEEMLFTSPLPEDFQSALDKWRHYSAHLK
jgi:23S rRNA pseudouridine1911/1915/1917 synthase